jgi:hypothetical protein
LGGSPGNRAAARPDFRPVSGIHWPFGPMECFQNTNHLPAACIFQPYSGNHTCPNCPNERRRGLFFLSTW